MSTAGRVSCAAECCLEGPCEHSRGFDRQMILARLRGNLLQAAHELADKLKRDDRDVNAENLRDALLFEVAHANPRSTLAPWNLEDSIVEKMMDVVVRDFFQRI